MGIIEAHEKGHVLRPYGSEYMRGRFASGFDLSRITFSEQEQKKIAIEFNTPDLADHRSAPLSREKMLECHLEYLFRGEEVAERMAQLKNYFGLRGAEPFTKEHLEYARAHYVPDTGLDNSMTQFFQAITPDTEAAFLRLINSMGI